MLQSVQSVNLTGTFASVVETGFTCCNLFPFKVGVITYNVELLKS